jgi:hypothetical protein
MSPIAKLAGDEIRRSEIAGQTLNTSPHRIKKTGDRLAGVGPTAVTGGDKLLLHE